MWTFLYEKPAYMKINHICTRVKKLFLSHLYLKNRADRKAAKVSCGLIPRATTTKMNGAEQPTAKRSRVSLTLAQKKEIAVKLRGPVDRKALAREYRCCLATITRISKSPDLITLELTAANGESKRERPLAFPQTDLSLFIWFSQARALDFSVDDLLLRQKAQEFAIEAGETTFSGSNGWLYSWKNRHGLSFKKPCGESKDADRQAVTVWERDVLPGILGEYSPNDLFNADETALFYKQMKRGTLTLPGEQLEGSKQPKSRITLLFICNATGSSKYVYAIGASERPRCFARTPSSVPYLASPNAWMTARLWNSILVRLDREMRAQDRKIALVYDGAYCHKVFEETILTHITLFKLPPNTTSIIQPLDQGIIWSFKSRYKTLVRDLMIAAIEAGQSRARFFRDFDLGRATRLVAGAWSSVPQELISNCFLKAWYKTVGETHLHPEAEEAPSELAQAESFPDDAEAFSEELSDAEILRLARVELGLETPAEALDETEGISAAAEVPSTPELETIPTAEEVLKCIAKIRIYPSLPAECHEHLAALEETILFPRLVQTRIDTFLSAVLP